MLTPPPKKNEIIKEQTNNFFDRIYNVIMHWSINYLKGHHKRYIPIKNPEWFWKKINLSICILKRSFTNHTNKDFEDWRKCFSFFFNVGLSNLEHVHPSISPLLFPRPMDSYFKPTIDNHLCVNMVWNENRLYIEIFFLYLIYM